MKTIEKDTNDAGRNSLETSDAARRAGLRRIARRHRTQGGEVGLRDVKVEITLSVDADVLEHFKACAAQTDAVNYQTAMNQALRDAMEHAATDAKDKER